MKLSMLINSEFYLRLRDNRPFNFLARGFVRSNRPQQGHHRPSHEMNTSHSGHRF